MSFKDKTFKERWNDSMWHHSEDAFERRWQGTKHRFGLNQDRDEHGIETWAMAAFIRHAPDYICQLKSRSPAFFMEVQGTGKDRKHKFKFEKLSMLCQWNKHHDVWLWLWDDKYQEETIISLPKLRLLIAQGHCERGSFDDGKRPYWAVHVDIVAENSDWRTGRVRYE